MKFNEKLTYLQGQVRVRKEFLANLRNFLRDKCEQHRLILVFHGVQFAEFFDTRFNHFCTDFDLFKN